MGQKEVVREIFTQSAEAYTARKALVDRASHELMVKLSYVKLEEQVLEVACGPGFVAQLLASRAKYVVGVDLALAQKAHQLWRERGLLNLNFVEGDAEHLPFSDGSFQLVTCHKAFHHFAQPSVVLQEIHRVLSRSGRLVLGDSLSSEDQEKNALHNKIEKLRDPSHVKMYGLNELKQLIASSGFKVDQFEVMEDERDFDWWMSVITPPPETTARIRGILIESAPTDGAGLGIRIEDGKLWLRRRNLILAAIRK